MSSFWSQDRIYTEQYIFKNLIFKLAHGTLCNIHSLYALDWLTDCQMCIEPNNHFSHWFNNVDLNLANNVDRKVGKWLKKQLRVSHLSHELRKSISAATGLFAACTKDCFSVSVKHMVSTYEITSFCYNCTKLLSIWLSFFCWSTAAAHLNYVNSLINKAWIYPKKRSISLTLCVNIPQETC